ncbi:hypothetical protein NDU88_004161 [Pleurodeles waltl]|uniref:Uncharacterized protein n=1 Tax=Pleurodeles waltl TaxID=8319 RepID=A0AAV7UEI7_PLEWA|nr:hypothetical protein NDU88_004161 [Pleurodeles waltl]
MEPSSSSGQKAVTLPGTMSSARKNYNNTPKRQKKDSASPTKSPLPLPLEAVMKEIKILKPFVMQTNATLQRIEEKWSNLELRVTDGEQRISTVQDAAAKTEAMSKEILYLKQQTEDLENRNRRNNPNQLDHHLLTN